MSTATQQYKHLTWDEFWETFQPLENHLDDNACQDGCMYETYGPEKEYVKSLANSENLADRLRVWTVLDCDGKTVIASGWHLVNRMGYLITKMPAPEGFYIEVSDDDDPSEDLDENLDDDLGEDQDNDLGDEPSGGPKNALTIDPGCNPGGNAAEAPSGPLAEAPRATKARLR